MRYLGKCAIIRHARGVAERSHRNKREWHVAALVVGKRLAVEAGVHHALLFQVVLKWKASVSLEHVQ